MQRGVRTHETARSASTHAPSRLGYGTRRPRFERNSICTCDMPLAGTTAHKRTHERSLTPALTHTHIHIFANHQHKEQTFPRMKEVRKKNKVCTCPTLGAPFELQKHITKCVRSKPSRTSSHRSISTIDAPAKTLESKAKNAPFLNLKQKSFIFTSRSSWISQCAPALE